MAEHVPCIICGKDDSVSFMEVKDRIGPLKQTYRLVKCQKCGLVYVTPQPSEEELEEHYPDFYWFQKPHSPSSLLHRILNRAKIYYCIQAASDSQSSQTEGESRGENPGCRLRQRTDFKPLAEIWIPDIRR